MLDIPVQGTNTAVIAVDGVSYNVTLNLGRKPLMIRRLSASYTQSDCTMICPVELATNAEYILLRAKDKYIAKVLQLMPWQAEETGLMLGFRYRIDVRLWRLNKEVL